MALNGFRVLLFVAPAPTGSINRNKKNYVIGLEKLLVFALITITYTITSHRFQSQLQLQLFKFK